MSKTLYKPPGALESAVVRVLMLAVQWVARIFYDIRPEGVENVPKTGGVLMVSNHVSYVDAIVMTLACPRKIRFLAHESFFSVPFVRAALVEFGTIPVSQTRFKDSIRIAADAVVAGELVCIFPEGQLTTTGDVNEIKRGYELIAARAEALLLPVGLEGLWGSLMSWERGRPFWKKPNKLRFLIHVRFGPTQPASGLPPDVLRTELRRLSGTPEGIGAKD